MFYKNLSRFDNMGFCCEGFPFGLLEAMVCFGEWRLLDLYHALTDLVQSVHIIWRLCYFVCMCVFFPLSHEIQLNILISWTVCCNSCSIGYNYHECGYFPSYLYEWLMFLVLMVMGSSLNLSLCYVQSIDYVVNYGMGVTHRGRYIDGLLCVICWIQSSIGVASLSTACTWQEPRWYCVVMRYRSSL